MVKTSQTLIGLFYRQYSQPNFLHIQNAIYKEVTNLSYSLFLNSLISLISISVFLPVDLPPDLVFKPRVEHHGIDQLEDSFLWLLRQQSLNKVKLSQGFPLVSYFW